MGNETHEPYSVQEYKGLKIGEIFEIDGKRWLVYRLDDKRNKITFVCRNVGFRYADVDEFLAYIKRLEK